MHLPVCPSELCTAEQDERVGIEGGSGFEWLGSTPKVGCMSAIEVCICVCYMLQCVCVCVGSICE